MQYREQACRRHETPEPMLTTAQLARVLAVSVRTVTRYVAGGVLTPTLTLPGGHWRWRESDVQAQLKARQDGADG